jgi:hypothetical protein
VSINAASRSGSTSNLQCPRTCQCITAANPQNRHLSLEEYTSKSAIFPPDRSQRVLESSYVGIMDVSHWEDGMQNHVYIRYHQTYCPFIPTTLPSPGARDRLRIYHKYNISIVTYIPPCKSSTGNMLKHPPLECVVTPRPISTQPRLRANEISPLLAGHDIVILNEAFIYKFCLQSRAGITSPQALMKQVSDPGTFACRLWTPRPVKILLRQD